MKTTEQKNLIYTECVRIWLKEIHPGWAFGAVQGKKMKSIIAKIKKLCMFKGLEGNNEQVIASFKNMCLRLPDWYKEKDLQVIDSKFNEIVSEIQQGPKKKFNDYNSSQLFGKYGHLI